MMHIARQPIFLRDLDYMILLWVILKQVYLIFGLIEFVGENYGFIFYFL